MDDGSSDDDENDEDPAQEPPQVESQGGEQIDEDDNEDEEPPMPLWVPSMALIGVMGIPNVGVGLLDGLAYLMWRRMMSGPPVFV